MSELEGGEDESDGVPVGCSRDVSELETGEDKSNGVSVGESAGGPIGAIGAAGWTAVIRSCCM